MPLPLEVLQDWPLWGITDTPMTDAQITPLVGGLNNACYRLDFPQKRYVLRIAGTEFGLDRALEYRLHCALAEQGLTANIHYCAPDHRYWLRDFVDGQVLSPEELTVPVLQALLQHLKKIHQLPVLNFMPDFSLETTAFEYWKKLAAKGYSEPFHHALFEEHEQLPKVLCHMDPTAGNWIQTASGGFVLLDWEYAALGNPWWDVAALLEQANLTQEQEQAVVASYAPCDPSIWQRAKAQMQYVAELWYCVKA